MLRFWLAVLVVGFGFAPWTFAADSDGDYVDDAHDVCCQTPPNIPVDENGRPRGDLDLDCDDYGCEYDPACF